MTSNLSMSLVTTRDCDGAAVYTLRAVVETAAHGQRFEARSEGRRKTATWQLVDYDGHDGARRVLASCPRPWVRGARGVFDFHTTPAGVRAGLPVAGMVLPAYTFE